MDYDLIATLIQDELITDFADAIRFGPLALALVALDDLRAVIQADPKAADCFG